MSKCQMLVFVFLYIYGTFIVLFPANYVYGTSDNRLKCRPHFCVTDVHFSWRRYCLNVSTISGTKIMAETVNLVWRLYAAIYRKIQKQINLNGKNSDHFNQYVSQLVCF